MAKVDAARHILHGACGVEVDNQGTPEQLDDDTILLCTYPWGGYQTLPMSVFLANYEAVLPENPSEISPALAQVMIDHYEDFNLHNLIRQQEAAGRFVYPP